MVKPIGEGYELIFGLHRLEACKRLGWRKISSIARAISYEDGFLASLVENLQRNIHINPVAEAEGYKHLLAKGYTMHEIAVKIGKTDSYVCNRLNIIRKLHPRIRKRLSFTRVNSGLTPSHAERLALIDDPNANLSWLNLQKRSIYPYANSNSSHGDSKQTRLKAAYARNAQTTHADA